MTRWNGGRDLHAVARAEWDHLVRFQASDRNWRMPLAAALASGLPLLIGVWLDRPDFGLVSSLGGMVFLYLPETPLDHRMVTIMACAFAMIGSYALGVISHFFPLLQIPALTFVAALTTMVCRYFRLPPPGCVFFVMAAAIGMYTPAETFETPTKVGLLALGALLACLIAFFYSLAMMRLRPPQPAPPPASADFDFVVVSSSNRWRSACSSAPRWRWRRRCNSNAPTGRRSVAPRSCNPRRCAPSGRGSSIASGGPAPACC